MSNHTNKSAFVATGLMLFALFFGAGNLIFPALMGQHAGENIFPAMAGFLITGAGLPLLGIIAVGYSSSRDLQDLASRVTPWYGILFTVSLYLAIGPLFAIPRTATTSFEIGLLPFISGKESQIIELLSFLGGNIPISVTKISLAVFAFVFFGLSYWLAINPGKLVDRIGRILTPALLISIAILVIYAAFSPMGAPQTPTNSYVGGSAFTQGILDGYQTMDALASLVFAIIVIDAVRSQGINDDRQVLSLTARAGFVAAFFLAVVYVFIAYMGATSVAGIGTVETGAQVLSKSAEYYFGDAGKTLLAIIVFLACLTTSVGLITACGEYFNRLIPSVSYGVWVTIFTIISFALSNFGLSTIISFSVPVLMLLYPLTVAIIALAFLNNLFGGKRIVYIMTILGTLPVALIDGWKTAYAMLIPKEQQSAEALVMQIDAFLNTQLPLYSQGLGWILPAATGFIIGIVLSKVSK
ncbi:branched-chain amino acid transport system II carrier protein [Pelistega ratti]|uniref:branched-chain amino acid transport system II carrier protein n=1 Tax=Pelistega ratti TaxID=2652177 RepID=UPI00135B9425|nr:branched-chain amino acid transport system II carrier protein [Pelistega ratti]